MSIGSFSTPVQAGEIGCRRYSLSHSRAPQSAPAAGTAVEAGGDTSALHAAVMYESGRGAEREPEHAKAWYGKALAAGYEGTYGF